jgi:hypothetical protein
MFIGCLLELQISFYAHSLKLYGLLETLHASLADECLFFFYLHDLK